MGAATISAVGPVRQADRLFAVDALRGFALLGILLMNIPTFALPENAYQNTNVWGGNDTLNRWVVTLVYFFGEGKMRAIFSLMFGASALLLIGRGEKRGAGIETADVYFRRTLWLMLFGLLHAYLIWWGDILYPYALLGLGLFAFRSMKPKGLIIIASVQIALLAVGFFADSWDTKSDLEKYEKARTIEKSGASLTTEQKKDKEKGEKILREMRPPQEELQKEIDAYRGNYVQNIKQRAKQVWKFHRLPFYFPFMWDMLALMFLGMALLKTGVLTGERSFGFYIKLALISGIAGLAINGVTMWLQWTHDFDAVQGSLDFSAYELGRVPMALCYVAVLVLIVKAGKMLWLTKRLAAVGQMALSNYISHSLICSTIFYGGYGFGLFGKLERWQLYVIVAAIWAFNLIWSPIWLRHFQFGPLEWCWRSLTYWKKQPMRIRSIAEVAQPQENPSVATLQ